MVSPEDEHDDGTLHVTCIANKMGKFTIHCTEMYEGKPPL